MRWRWWEYAIAGALFIIAPAVAICVYWDRHPLTPANVRYYFEPAIGAVP